MTNTRAHVGARAVVIGGSIGGLLAARVLADFYDEVVVADRDRFGRYGEDRRGVGQAPHSCVLLAGGRRALEQLLPGAIDELAARGAVDIDFQGTGAWITDGHALARGARGPRGLLTGQAMLEHEIRRRVREIPNVALHEHRDVLGFTLDPRGRVNGVRAAWRGVDDAEDRVDCDLLVDASGRGSRMPAWLHALGYETPPTDEIVVGLSCTTRAFVRTEAGTDNVVVTATVDSPRGGALLAQPDGRSVVTLAGYLGESAPTDLDGFRAFASTLPTSDLAEAMEGLTPVGDARTFKFRAATWRRYDRVRRLPQGLIVLGDAVCSLNPLAGQGTSVAAREALALRGLLDEGSPALGRRFFAATRRVIAVPWELAAAADLQLPAVRGRRTTATRLTSWHLRNVVRAAHRDDEMARRFLDVVNLEARPTTLHTPAALWRIGKARGAPTDRRPPARIGVAGGDR